MPVHSSIKGQMRTRLWGVLAGIVMLSLLAATVTACGGAARFNQPFGIACDAAGNLYGADTNNCTIRKITWSR